MLGNLIYSQYLSARDWPMGSALGFILVVIMLALLFGQAMLASRASGETEGRRAPEPAGARCFLPIERPTDWTRRERQVRMRP